MPGRTAKKSTTPTKAAKKGHRYDYCDLAKASVTSSDTHHVYGVIIDATFPYKVNKDKYVCSVKVIDNSLHAKGAKPSDNDFATIVIYAKRFEDLPIVHRVGDILRVHRATLRLYKNHRQFNVSTQWNGSWAMFSTDKNCALDTTPGDFVPMAFSGKKPSFEAHEKQIVGGLRNWAKKWFADHDGVTKDMYRPLSKAKSADSDFDVVARVVRIHEMDEYTNELCLRDGSGESWHTLALKLKFPHLRAGMVVRIRSASNDVTSTHKRVLALSHYSNIMSFISDSRLEKSMSGVKADRADDMKALNADVPMTAVHVSSVAAKHANMPVTSLHDLFHNADSLKGDTFRTCFSVIRVNPGNHAEMVKCYDAKTKKASSCKGQKCATCIWQVEFYCKDASTAGNSNQYRILNYSHEGLGANFFGKASNLHSDAAARKRVDNHVANLLKFNAHVDCVVERRNGWYYIKDTTM